MSKTKERTAGPEVTTTYSCFNCKYEMSERYRCQSDSGHDVYCTHPSFLERKRIGDTTWNTPEFCPFRKQPEQEQKDIDVTQVESDNELIAEFMGAKVYTNWGLYLDNTYYKFKHGRPTNDSPLTFEEIEHNRVIEQMAIWNPKYDTSWDWLMPVVKKILHLYANSNHDREWDYQIYGLRAALRLANLEMLYKATINFIKWYNQQSK